MSWGLALLIIEIIICIIIFSKAVKQHIKFKYEFEKETSRFIFIQNEYNTRSYGLEIERFGKNYWVYLPDVNKNLYFVEELIYKDKHWEKKYVGFTTHDAIDKHICPNTGRSILP